MVAKIPMNKQDIEKAKSGARLVTDYGKPARVICWDADGQYPVVALIYEIKTDSERVVMLSSSLRAYLDENESFDDLHLFDSYPHGEAHIEVHGRSKIPRWCRK